MDCNNLHLHRWLKESLGAYEQIKKECLALYTRFSSLAEERNGIRLPKILEFFLLMSYYEWILYLAYKQKRKYSIPKFSSK